MNNELTPLEFNVMEMLAQGLTCYTIMELNQINYKQYVKVKKNILKKMGIKRITQILYRAIEIGLINF